MKKIYIILTYTGTILSRIVKIYTRKEYSHVSISLDKELTKMYSFGRLNPYNPFWGGFVHEAPKKGTFKRFKNTTSKIYSLEITDEQYQNMEKVIEEFNKQEKNYHFNTLGLIGVIMNYRIQRKESFYCAEFVKYVFEHSNITIELPEIIKPDDFEKIQGLSVVYTGRFNEYEA